MPNEFNKYGVCTNYDVGYESRESEFEFCRVLLAEDTKGLWHYSVIDFDGGYFPSKQGLAYKDKDEALSAGKEELRIRIKREMDWYDNARKISNHDEAIESYSARYRLFEKHLEALNELTLF